METALKTLLCLAVATVGVLSNQCAPPNEACQCSDSMTMLCSPAEKYPTNVASSVTELIIDDCTDGMQEDASYTLPVLNYPNVTRLLVRRCEINTIAPDAFKNMGKLQVLDLTSNMLTVVRAADFNGLRRLTDLGLSKNSLSNLPDDVFSNTPALEKLKLNGNDLLGLDAKAFDSISGTLKELHMEDIGTKEMPTDILSSLNELTVLELNDNKISIIPEGVWDNLGKLKRLDMNNCDLRTGSITTSTFRNLHNLEFLNLGFNTIDQIPNGAFDPFKDSLKTLYIEHNILKSLNARLLNWDKMEILNISGNPWECNCDIAWMADLDMSALAGHFATNVT